MIGRVRGGLAAAVLGGGGSGGGFTRGGRRTDAVVDGSSHASSTSVGGMLTAGARPAGGRVGGVRRPAGGGRRDGLFAARSLAGGVEVRAGGAIVDATIHPSSTSIVFVGLPAVPRCFFRRAIARS